MSQRCPEARSYGEVTSLKVESMTVFMRYKAGAGNIKDIKVDGIEEAGNKNTIPEEDMSPYRNPSYSYSLAGTVGSTNDSRDLRTGRW